MYQTCLVGFVIDEAAKGTSGDAGAYAPRWGARGGSAGCASGSGLTTLTSTYLRKFMETYGWEMGYSITQVAMRPDHDPSIAAMRYSGRVTETDRALAKAVALPDRPAARRERGVAVHRPRTAARRRRGGVV
jgi:hypothetical protein